MEEVEWQRRIYAEIFTLAFYKQIASFPWPEKQKELVELSKILQNNSFQPKTGWGEDRNRSENKTTEEYTCNWKAEIFSTKRLVSQTGLENHKMVNPIRISNFHEFSCHCVSWQHSTILKTMKFMKRIDYPNFSKLGRKELEFRFLSSGTLKLRFFFKMTLLLFLS